jgi:hypothetical protein
MEDGGWRIEDGGWRMENVFLCGIKLNRDFLRFFITK